MMLKRLKSAQTWDWVLLIALTIGGIARYWGTHFCLPHTECRPDETAIVSLTIGFFTGDLNPHFFQYPALYLYLLFGVYLVYFGWGKLTGNYSTATDIIQEFIHNPTHLYWLNRLLSASLGVLSIWLVYHLTKRLFNQAIARIAAIFLSLTYLHIRDSHFGVTDVALSCFVLLAMIWIVQSYQTRRLSDYWLSGLTIGLAMSIKYPGLLLVLPLLISHGFNIKEGFNIEKDSSALAPNQRYRLVLLQWLGMLSGGLLLFAGIALTPDVATAYLSADGQITNTSLIQVVRSIALAIGGFLGLFFGLLPRNRFLSAYFDRRLFSFAIGFGVTFCLVNSFALLNIRQLIASVLWISLAISNTSTAAEIKISSSTESAWMQHLSFILPTGLGWLLFGAGLLGVMLLIKSTPRLAIVLLAFPIVYFLVFGRSNLPMARYMVPIVPFLCITAALAIVTLSQHLARLLPSPQPKFSLLLALTTLVLLQPIETTLQFNSLLSRLDTRQVATQWVHQNIAPGASIYQTGAEQAAQYAQLQLDRSPATLANDLQAILGDISVVRYFKTHASDLISPLSQEISYQEISQTAFEPLRRGAQPSDLPDYIITFQHPLIEKLIEKEANPDITNLLNRFYYLRQSFIAVDTSQTQARFNPPDQFYAPLSGFRQIERSGPNIFIYALSTP